MTNGELNMRRTGTTPSNDGMQRTALRAAADAAC
jgi:hypothetical protein